MTTVRRIAAGGVCGLLLTGAAAACGPGDGPPRAAETGPAGTTGSARPGPGETAAPSGSAGADPAAPTGAGGLDLHRSGDLGFYRSFSQEGADWVDHYRGLDEAARASTAVVVARVVDVVVTRIFQGDAAGDRFPVIGLVLRPTDIVAGSLPAQSGAPLIVEFVGSGITDDEQIAMLKRRLPAQPGLWFLRLKVDGLPAERGFFRVVAPQGLFVQGNQRVETPLTTGGDGDMGAEGRTYRRLSDLVKRVRGVR